MKQCARPLPRLSWDTAAAEIPFLVHELARAAAPRCFASDWIQLRLPPALVSSPHEARADQMCWIDRRAAGGSQEDACAHVDDDMTYNIDDNVQSGNGETRNNTDVVSALADPGSATAYRSWQCPPPTLAEYLEDVCVLKSEDVANALRRVPVLGEALQQAEQRSGQSLIDHIEVLVAAVDEHARREQQVRANLTGVQVEAGPSSDASQYAATSEASIGTGGNGKELTWRVFAHVAPSLIQRSLGATSPPVATHSTADTERYRTAWLELPLAFNGDAA